MIEVVLSLLLSQATPVHAHKVVLPPLTLKCDTACQERVQQARADAAKEHTMLHLLEDFITGKVIACKYEEPGVVWVRQADKTGGECKPIKLPPKKRTGWK